MTKRLMYGLFGSRAPGFIMARGNLLETALICFILYTKRGKREVSLYQTVSFRYTKLLGGKGPLVTAGRELCLCHSEGAGANRPAKRQGHGQNMVFQNVLKPLQSETMKYSTFQMC